MNLFKKILGKKSEFNIRFNKTDNQYQVYRNNQLLYVGTKELCERYVENTHSLA